MGLNYKKVRETAITPTKGSERSAGWDLYSNNLSTITINPHEQVMIATGLAFAIPNGYFGAIYARSGMATKYGLRPSNCVGIIDSDYRGEVMVPLYNDSEKVQTVVSGERIAQMIIQPYYTGDLELFEELDSTSRGEGGFGSTGEK